MSSGPNAPATAAWTTPGYAASWSAADGLAGLLSLPWRMTAALVGLQRPPGLVLDVGSGPGTFLDELLTCFPDAQGIWLDASEDMLESARRTLARHGERVSYVVADAAEFATLDLPAGIDVITNSRVAHHFELSGLRAFYRQAAERLAPGGWLVTLDHIRPTDEWDSRFRTVLPAFAGSNAGKPTHPHYFPFPTVDDHLAALTAAGFDEVEMPWRAFYTCLFVGHRH
jgi:SAM-dependent methyltransferase